ncbi:PVC-type heme-binding CxxCH protein [Schlesneria sp. DSM 10557]|uniref:PVC-type heme-binding CxxCH protein n=1 Tax=Schlesneria sp. DSM 10557 TaxID=3044399 RepID=UPI0035A0D79E
MKWHLCVFVLCISLSSTVSAQSQLELKKGDHICIVGGTVAERMQHYGWLETYIHAKFPDAELVFRNLAYSGDEINGFRDRNKRLRSMDFGTHDQWLSGNAPCPQVDKLSKRDEGKVRENRFELTNTNADVVFAFYGYNESFAGEAGLAEFKENVDAFIKHTLSQQYNGKSAPRLVLFSPIAHEFVGDPNLLSRTQVVAANARLNLYSNAMGEVARANSVLFVDLFTPTLKLFNGDSPVVGNSRDSKAPVATINGVHQNADGDRTIARVAVQGLFKSKSEQLDSIPASRLSSIQAAVNDKNFYWYNRYRVTDGYSTYGDRAFLKFSEGPGGYGDGLSNYSVGQRELDVLDTLTSNRDKVVWAAAQGKTIKPDDTNLPQFLEVISNKPGPLEGGKHLFLSGEEAIKKMTVAKNIKVELFADESMFPELINPVQMAFDTRGRLWVATWPTYPHWKPTTPMNDSLLILEDTNHDGKADKCITFAGDLHNPTGFEFWGGGVLVAQGPDLLFLKDTNGDDKYDVKERVVHGFDTADTHHTINSFALDPGGAMYFQEGTFHHSQIETPWGAPRRVANGAVFRYEPRSQKTDVYVTYGFANPHGHSFNAWGQDIVVDGTGSAPYDATLMSSFLEYPHKHSGTPTVYKQRTRPCPAIEYLSSSHFPEEMRGSLLVGNVIGLQGILQYKVFEDGGSFGATEFPETLVMSSDPNFRPADIETAPDGTIYFTDWQNPIIGHMQHNLRDPNRDRIHGRVYRIRYEGRDLIKPIPIAGQPIGKLLDVLKEKDDRVRSRARIELSARLTADVIAALEPWLARLDKNHADYDHHALEGLWVHQHHNVLNTALLEQLLKARDHRARAAAIRVLQAWRDRVSNTLDLLKQAANDEAPRVRLQAIWAASFLPQAEAAEVVLIAREKPTDAFIDHMSKEVMRTLQPYLDLASRENRRVEFTSDAGARYFLKSLTNDQLLNEKRDRLVYVEMLNRPGLRDEARREAIEGLSRLDNKPQLAVIMDAINTLDGKQSNADVTVIFDLVRQLTGRSAAELTTARAELEKLATSAKQPIFRQIGFVSLINVDGTIDKSWALATTSSNHLIDFVNALPLISDASIRASLYDKVVPLLDGLPASIAGTTSKGTLGRYVRVELPGKGTLTLAEVEVLSGGVNIARRGKATQKNTASGGDASRGIDGNKSGAYGDGGQTHTEENTAQPWWEVDLGEVYPIDQINIFNRTEIPDRLDQFTLKVLDDKRAEVFVKEKNPAPKVSVSFTLEGGGPESLVRRAAMLALTYVRGQEPRTFSLLQKFVKEDVERSTAIRALQRLPQSAWPKDEAAPLLEVLIASIQKTPAADRTSPAALDALEFSDALTTLLPVEEAKKTRAILGELGVRVIKIGTIFEKMAFDKDLVVVAAGKPVEFLLENSDLMPHNFVITQPGALEEIGLMSEANAQQPAFAERYYVPQSDKVLAKSTLLQPRDSQRVSFTAPQQPGVYPFVCTYPGHWRRMYGALYVVPNLDEYLASPEPYLAANHIEPVDALLKDRRPRTEWKFEDLSDIVATLAVSRGHGNSDDHSHARPNFGNGKQLFTVANCVGCHKFDGAGREFGPDLTKLEPKWTSVDILKEILDPSAKINDKYQTNVIELGNGKVVTGLVVEETPDVIKIVENPLIKAEPIEVKRSEIVEREKSKVSIMPKGLLDKLTRDEILDLVAYVNSRGNRNHPVYKAGAEKGGHKH